MRHLTLVPALLLIIACDGGNADDSGLDTDPSSDDSGSDSDTESDSDSDTDSDTDTTVIRPDFEEDSALGRARLARCGKVLTCGEGYSCETSPWEEEDACLAEAYDAYSGFSDAQLEGYATYFNDTSCTVLFEGFTGFCANDDHNTSCDCPSGTCDLEVPAGTDVVLDRTVNLAAWGRTQGLWNGAGHDYGFAFYIPELQPEQTVAMRLTFSSALRLDPGGPGQLVSPGLLIFEQNTNSGQAHPYSFGTPALDASPDTSTFGDPVLSNDGKQVYVQLKSGEIQCAMLTFTTEGMTAGTWNDPLMNLMWRTEFAVGSEPVGFQVDGKFERP